MRSLRLLPLLAVMACPEPPGGHPTDDEIPESDPPDTDEETDDTDVDSDGGDALRSDTRTWGTTRATVDLLREDAPRRWRFVTDLDLHDGTYPLRLVDEPSEGVRLLSNDLFLDGLFAMARVELEELAVSSVSDGAFASGDPVPCVCWQTGAEWRWVWTRDIAYAADLGLGIEDPVRAWNSLRFKLSAPKAGGALRIVQDTGSGGSWPVSTDRVVWALGARATRAWGTDGVRRDVEGDGLEALAATIADDREAVFDPEDGLYFGEQSFLDWREQSYPSWTADDTVHLATSKALSTNVGHLMALRLAAELGEAADHPDAATWAAWADDLAEAIPAHFTGPHGMLYAMTGPLLEPSLSSQRDLLAESLAILEGTVDEETGHFLVTTYPRTHAGPPVFVPFQPGVPIYHNRAIWPFVTAYSVLAARHVGHDEGVTTGFESLIRGPATTLSHMENYEAFSHVDFREDGDLSGPVVNSRRQLWSVAGFVGAVVRGLFGVEPTDEGLVVAPFVPGRFRDRWLAESDEITLDGLLVRGRDVDIHVSLPPVGSITGGGAYAVEEITVNGRVVEGPIPWDEVYPAVVRVSLTAEGATEPSYVAALGPGNEELLFAPREPTGLTVTGNGPSLLVQWDEVSDPNIRYRVSRDGITLASEHDGRTWIDFDVDPHLDAPCYTVRADHFLTERVSHPTPPVCWWDDDARVQTYDAHRTIQTSGDAVWSTQHGRPHLMDWGEPTDALTVFGVRPRHTGPHLIQPVAGNGAGAVNTGITAAHKRVVVREEATLDVVAEGTVVMPHLGSWDVWGDGSFLPVHLDADTAYRIELSDAGNMSALEHYRIWTAGPGGGEDPYGFVNVAAVKLLSRGGPARAWSAGDTLAFDGVDDLDAFDADQVVLPGAPLQPWGRFALDWDEDFLYVTLVSEAFEEDFVPWMIYLQAGDAPLAAAEPGVGMDYALGQVSSPAELPFVPTHVIALRAEPASGPDGGPWNGVWAARGASFQQVGRLAQGVDWHLAADRHTLSARVPRALLGDHDTVRLVSHVIWGQAGNEWKALVPSGHTPWQGPGGFLTLDLTAADHAATGWLPGP